MAARCDLLLTNALVLTMDERFTIHQPGALAVSGDSIVAVGPEAATLEAAERIDCGGNVVMPGLVNAHTHVAMSLLRGLADDLRLDVWLMGYMMPVERAVVTPEFVRLGTALGCAEMMSSGAWALPVVAARGVDRACRASGTWCGSKRPALGPRRQRACARCGARRC